MILIKQSSALEVSGLGGGGEAGGVFAEGVGGAGGWCAGHRGPPARLASVSAACSSPKSGVTTFWGRAAGCWDRAM